jgi:hypothetical protein
VGTIGQRRGLLSVFLAYGRIIHCYFACRSAAVLKKGLIGPFHLGGLEMACEALKFAEKTSGQPGFDLENVFYASAFQAGIDRFLFPKLESVPLPASEFIRGRTEFTASECSREHYRIVGETLSRVLPENWIRDERFSNVWFLQAFLVDLLDAMASKASYLAVWGMPDPAQLEGQLPREICVPIATFLQSFETVQPALPTIQRTVTREDFRRLCEILQGDLFKSYSESQAHFDAAPVSVETALAEVNRTGRKLVAENGKLLSIAKGGVSVLSLSAKLIDAVFGKIPGAAAEAFAKLGQQLLQDNQRIVVYDFERSLRELMLTNLVRMIRAGANTPA